MPTRPCRAALRPFSDSRMRPKNCSLSCKSDFGRVASTRVGPPVPYRRIPGTFSSLRAAGALVWTPSGLPDGIAASMTHGSHSATFQADSIPIPSTSLSPDRTSASGAGSPAACPSAGPAQSLRDTARRVLPCTGAEHGSVPIMRIMSRRQAAVLPSIPRCPTGRVANDCDDVAGSSWCPHGVRASRAASYAVLGGT